MKTCVIYMTAPNVEEARRIACTLVDERLAACANILGPIESIYRWEGKVEEAQETAFIAKTAKSRVEALTARVKELHSYECPCVVALPIEAGHPPFLDWIAGETTPLED